MAEAVEEPHEHGEAAVPSHVGIGELPVARWTQKVDDGEDEGAPEEGGFGLAAELEVNIPGVSIEKAQELTQKAHQICPYSNATRSNMEVKLSVTNN